MTEEWKQLREQRRYSDAEFPLSTTNAQRLLVKALEEGNVDVLDHFKRRCAERNFTTVDAERIIRTGRICGKPRRDSDYENWRITVRGKYEGKRLEISVALDLNVDCETPLITLITGVRKGGSE